MDNQIPLRNIYSDLPSIETGRLNVRKMRSDDAADMFAFASDPEITQFRSWRTHLSIDDSRLFIAETRAKYTQGVLADWGIEHSADRVLIGTIGFQCIRSGYIAELGFTLSKKYRHNGLALETVTCVTEFGFVHLGFHRIESIARIDDSSTFQVLESAGFRCEGELKDYRYQKGRFVTVRMYALLRRDYHR